MWYVRDSVILYEVGSNNIMYMNSSHDAYPIEEESDEECAER